MRHLAWIFGVVAAVLFHAGFLLFGGLIFGAHKEKPDAPREVTLVSDAGMEETKDEKKDESTKMGAREEEDSPEMEAEEIPNAEEFVKNLEISAAAAAPALDALSLSAIEQALSGQAVGGEFSDSANFASGGRIGGTARPGQVDSSLENAFNMDEIDQKPRETFKTPPAYPVEMRGKKVEGLVSLIFIVDATGKVTNPRVEKSSHPAFERPALDAIRQWRFEPGLRSGVRVGCKMRVSIRFKKS
jgi:protein TonB